jgi:hypothetical protein
MWHPKRCSEQYTHKRNEAKENIRRIRALSRMAHDRTRMERKRKQAMLKKRKQTKTSTKDAMDKANIKRKTIRSWDEMTSGDHEAGVKIAPRGANTNNYEEAIKRILRRPDTEAPRGASYKGAYLSFGSALHPAPTWPNKWLRTCPPVVRRGVAFGQDVVSR